MKKFQHNQKEMEFNGTHQLLVYAIVDNILAGSISTTKNTETMLNASREVGLEVNTEKTKCMALFVTKR